MKNAFILFIILLIFSSYTPEYEEFDVAPILMTREAMESSIAFIASEPIKKPGKIYIIDNLLFINEKYKGIHVVDNATPSSPVKTGFIRIPGCIDMAVKGNILYADNAVDLIAIDISNLSDLKVTRRIKNTFPELLPPGYDYIPWKFEINNRPENTIIVGWETINLN